MANLNVDIFSTVLQQNITFVICCDINLDDY